jgi:hypothetical protein
MVVRTHPFVELVIVFERNGQEIRRLTVHNGERAAQVAALLIARLGGLEPGDVMTVNESSSDLIVEVLGIPHREG